MHLAVEIIHWFLHFGDIDKCQDECVCKVLALCSCWVKHPPHCFMLRFWCCAFWKPNEVLTKMHYSVRLPILHLTNCNHFLLLQRNGLAEFLIALMQYAFTELSPCQVSFIIYDSIFPRSMHLCLLFIKNSFSYIFTSYQPWTTSHTITHTGVKLITSEVSENEKPLLLLDYRKHSSPIIDKGTNLIHFMSCPGVVVYERLHLEQLKRNVANINDAYYT